MRGCLAVASLAMMLGCSGSGRSVSPIRLEPMATLGDTGGEGGIANTPLVSARHPAGFRVVLQARNAIGAPPLAFSDAGSFLGALRSDSAHGASTEGFLFTRFGPGDSIWVFDSDLHVQMFDGQFRYGRQLSVPVLPSDALPLENGRLVVSAADGSDVQLLDASGSVVRRYGDGKRVRRLLIDGGRGTLWTASSSALQLEHWDTAGKLLESKRFDAAWLDTPAAKEGPAPAIVAAWIDTDHRLWCVGAVADHHWQGGVDATAGTIVDYNRYLDTIIEVRDLATGRVLASAVFDKAFRNGGGPGFVAGEAHSSGGWIRVELLRIVLDPIPVRR